MGKPTRSPGECFWPYVEIGTCWLWTRATSPRGYGMLNIGGHGNSMSAHRYAWELLVGPIPEGLTLDHVQDRGCTSRACVKAIADKYGPAHLEVVTQAENNRRWAEIYKARMRTRSHCRNGHPWNEENLYITRHGWWACRSCRSESKRRKRAERKSQTSG